MTYKRVKEIGYRKRNGTQKTEGGKISLAH